MHKYKELTVWQKSVELAVDVYKITGEFPKEELYSLVSQVKRSAVSVPSNIAEGAGRNSSGEFVHFLGISNGSSSELETQLIIANKLGYIKDEALDTITKKINEVQNMTFKLQQKIKK